MPVVALIWVLLHGLGTNVAMLVVGVHSILFTFLGRDDKKSPYNIVAIAGFVAFVIMVFWDKLNLHLLNVYVIPVGLGVLTLLHLFGDQLPVETAIGCDLLPCWPCSAAALFTH